MRSGFGNRTGAEVDFRLREGSRQRLQARGAVSGTSASVVLEGPMGKARRGSWLFSARQSYLDLILNRLQQEGLDFSFADTQAKFAYDVSASQRVEITFLAGHSRLQEKREAVDAGELATGRNASAFGIASWRLTGRRGLVTSRVLLSGNRFRNENPGVVEFDRGHDTQVAGRVDAAVPLGRAAQLEGGVQADWTGEGRVRRRSSGGAYRVINDFDAQASRTGGYAQVRWTAGPLTLVPGARAESLGADGGSDGVAVGAGGVEDEPNDKPARRSGGVSPVPRVRTGDRRTGEPGGAVGTRAPVHFGFEQRMGADLRWQATLFDREEDGFFRRIGADTRLVNGRVVSRIDQRGATGRVWMVTRAGSSCWFSGAAPAACQAGCRIRSGGCGSRTR